MSAQRRSSNSSSITMFVPSWAPGLAGGHERHHCSGVRTRPRRRAPSPRSAPLPPPPLLRVKMTTQVDTEPARYVGPPGQDPSEIFDVYSPPTPGHNGFATSDMVATPLKQKSRNEVHRDGDWHRSVHTWLVHPPTKTIVIQKRSPWKDTNPNKWDVSAAGHITHGQISEETARKELEEELGFVSDGCELHYLFTSISEHAHGTTKCNLYQDVYLVEVNRHPEDIEFCSLGQCEVADVKFVPIEWLKDALDDHASGMFVRRPEAYRRRIFECLEERYFRGDDEGDDVQQR